MIAIGRDKVRGERGRDRDREMGDGRRDGDEDGKDPRRREESWGREEAYDGETGRRRGRREGEEEREEEGEGEGEEEEKRKRREHAVSAGQSLQLNVEHRTVRILTEEARAASVASASSSSSTSIPDDLAAQLRNIGSRVRKNVLEGYTTAPTRGAFAKAHTTGRLFVSAKDALREVYPQGRSSRSYQPSPSSKNKKRTLSLSLLAPLKSKRKRSVRGSGDTADRPMKPLRKPRQTVMATRSLPAESSRFSTSSGNMDASMRNSADEEDWSLPAAEGETAFAPMMLMDGWRGKDERPMIIAILGVVKGGRQRLSQSRALPESLWVQRQFLSSPSLSPDWHHSLVTLNHKWATCSAHNAPTEILSKFTTLNSAASFFLHTPLQDHFAAYHWYLKSHLPSYITSFLQVSNSISAHIIHNQYELIPASTYFL
ncbi:hypothetical protein BDQ17DRAFT_1323552 [Cyathus striatus]|nr:hypothetical protein BDQ17DRAFT_1323552 [Cyathus striatus]